MKTLNLELRSLKYDKDQLQVQIHMCRDRIENGNWEGYSDNLKIRKERLKREEEALAKIDEEIILLENK